MDFLQRLNAQILIADGATGTNYQLRGLPPGTSPESWVFDRPDEVLRLHEAFIDAGADVVLTCTFGGNSFRHREGRIAELNRKAADLARKAVAGAPVFVAGSMGPTGRMLEPLGDLKREDVVDAYREQALALAEGGVDLLVLETFFSIEEAEAAVDGVRSVTDLPLVCSFSYDRGLRTMMGVRPSQMAESIGRLGVAAIGANCGSTLENMELIVRELAEHSGGIPVWAKPNAGQPSGDPPVYPVGPQEMASRALRFAHAGARIIGGCCGTTPEHIRAVSESVRSTASS